MSALHYFDQGLSTPLGNPLSNAKSISKLYYSLTPHQWSAFKCVDTIHTWVEEAPELLKKEALSSIAKGGGWAPRKDSTLGKIVKEALDENAPTGSLWRFIYIQEEDIKPVIIFGVIYIHWKDNFESPKKKPKSKDDGKSKSKLNPEEEAKRWSTAAKQFLVEMLMEIELPSKIVDGIEWIKPKKSKKRKKGL
jgi:hypothetical protein